MRLLSHDDAFLARRFEMVKPQIVGISGSPICNGNTERIVRRILDDSGLAAELVRLWDMD